MNLVISELVDHGGPVEFVERKGLGHPDSICDALAQNLSRNLCRHYLDRFGTILHHNVDKALLVGGAARPAFGGGEVLRPVEIHLSGRATTAAGDKSIPIEEIAVEGSRAWLRENLHAFDADRHVRLHSAVRSGAQSLTELFSRRSGARTVPLANDTSFGVGYAPLSPLETLVLKVERLLNGRERSTDHPAWGEDIKVMAVRHDGAVSLTLACAMIGRHLSGIDAYVAEIEALRRRIEGLAADSGFDECRIRVNAADDIAAQSVYLTVTGTSAEAGDDGEVGRGNRVNGLITPFRPMSLEAAAGKNPVSHVGLIYNVLAREIAQTIVAALPVVAAVQCYIVSEIGSPVSEPALIHVRLATRDGSPAGPLEERTSEIARQVLLGLDALTERFVAGLIDLY